MAAREATLKLWKLTVANSKELIRKTVYYGKVELVPPKPTDFPAIKSGFQNLISSAKTGKYRELTVREAWLNTLVAIEIWCWFYIGECIGKQHIIGYKA